MKITLKQVERLAKGECAESVIRSRFDIDELVETLAKRVISAKKEAGK